MDTKAEEALTLSLVGSDIPLGVITPALTTVNVETSLSTSLDLFSGPL